MKNPRFSARAQSSVGPAMMLAPVSPADDADLPGGATRAIFVGGAGDLTVLDSNGTAVTIVSAAHQYHPITVRRVLATGTTATAILALY